MNNKNKYKNKISGILKNIDRILDDLLSNIDGAGKNKLKPVKVKVNENKKRV